MPWGRAGAGHGVGMVSSPIPPGSEQTGPAGCGSHSPQGDQTPPPRLSREEGPWRASVARPLPCSGHLVVGRARPWGLSGLGPLPCWLQEGGPGWIPWPSLPLTVFWQLGCALGGSAPWGHVFAPSRWAPGATCMSPFPQALQRWRPVLLPPAPAWPRLWPALARGLHPQGCPQVRSLCSFQLLPLPPRGPHDHPGVMWHPGRGQDSWLC